MEKNNVVKELKSEDFVILCVQNKELLRLNEILGEREKRYLKEISTLNNKLEQTEKRNKEFQMLVTNQSVKLNQFEIIKDELKKDYKLMNEQIECLTNFLLEKEKEIYESENALLLCKKELKELKKSLKEKEIEQENEREFMKQLKLKLTNEQSKMFELNFDLNFEGKKEEKKLRQSIKEERSKEREKISM